jgi:hypothetical protein
MSFLYFLKHHSDIEWKFAKSKLYMEYIKQGFTLPVPLNLIPTPLDTFHFIKSIIKKVLNRKRHFLCDSMKNGYSSDAQNMNGGVCNGGAGASIEDQQSAFELKTQINSFPINSNNCNNNISAKNQQNFKMVFEIVLKD